MKIQVSKVHKNLLLLFILFTNLTNDTVAQYVLNGTSYSQNFDNIESGLPTGWTVDTGATASILGVDVSSTFLYKTPATNTNWSNTTGRFKNVASCSAFPIFATTTTALQTAATNRALGIRQSASFEQKTAFVFQIDNTLGFENFSLSFMLQSLDSSSERITTWTIDYGIGTNPTLFHPIAATGISTTGGFNYGNHLLNINFGNAIDNQFGPVYIRIICLTPTTGAGFRTTSAIDDFELNWNIIPPATNILLTNYSPIGDTINTNVATATFSFDLPIEAGNGLINLYKRNPSTLINSFNIPSTNVAILGNTAIVTGLTLENNSGYYFQMMAGTFTDTSGLLPNLSIIDTSTLVFSTIDTITPALPTQFNETFTGCLNTSLSGFAQYNMAGIKSWICSTLGHDDNAAVQISGGIASNSSNENDDWLITKEAYDFSSMRKPFLSFWQKSRFEGNVFRTLKISTDFNPLLGPSYATWITIPEQAMSVKPAGEELWSQIKNIDLTSYKNTPFYIAFTYSCNNDGAYELTYDDIEITEAPENPEGIYGNSINTFSIKTLGSQSSSNLLLAINSPIDASFQFQIYDLTGRIIYRKIMDVSKGFKTYQLTDLYLNNGMYIIKVNNHNCYAVIKTVINGS